MWITGYALPFVLSHEEETQEQGLLTWIGWDTGDQGEWWDFWVSESPNTVPYEYCMTSATIALGQQFLLTHHERYNDWVSITTANWM